MNESDRNPYASPRSRTSSPQTIKPLRPFRNIALLIIASTVVGFVLSPADPQSMAIYTIVILAVVGWAYWLGGRN